MTTHTTCIQHFTGDWSKYNKARKEGINIKKGEVKLFADDMISYIEKPKEFTKQLEE